MLWKKCHESKPLIDLEVKVTWRSLHYATHRLMVMHPYTKYHWPISKEKLFDLVEVKGQGPTKVITVCDTPPYGHAPIYQVSLTYLENKNVMARTRKYYFILYLTLRSKVKVLRRSLWYATHRLMVMHPQTKYHWPIQCGKPPLANSPKASGNFGWRVTSTLYSPVWRVTVVRRIGTWKRSPR